MTHPQAHEQFKAFTGINANEAFNAVEAFVGDGAKVSPRSIGVAAIDGSAVVTLGYTEDKGHAVSVRKFGLGSGCNDPTAIEETITEIVADQEHDVICHDIYSSGGALYLVLLCTR